MTKLNTPLLSLESHGTLGGAITFQSGGRRKFAREKPVPAYRNTLPQQYQRWLYEDYAYLWRQQSLDTRQEYASNGVRFHLTGFQYWMKVMLSTMPDYIGLWHLDHNAIDSSRAGNHGVIFGATPDTGLINGCYYADGINDHMLVPYVPAFDLLSDFTIFCFVHRTILGSSDGFLAREPTAGAGRVWTFYLSGPTNTVRFFFSTNGTAWTNQPLISAIASPKDVWQALCVTRAGSNFTLYIDTIIRATGVDAAIPKVSNVDLCLMAIRPNSGWMKGYQDHSFMLNRALDQTEVTRHTERRYSS